ncbi:MAG: tetratricopeptide repeat protein, partial [Magnetococcales bacterium]|nr:tetratricopeptide repeat protein [Magnetococcales bacterium]
MRRHANKLANKLKKKQHIDSSSLSAIPSYNDIHKLPNSFRIGLSCHQSGQLDQALVWYKRAVLEQPDNSDAYANIAIIFRKQGDLVGAITNFKNALAINPSSAELLNSLGMTLIDIGEHKEAAICFK